MSVYGTAAIKNIVENWMRGEEWERIKCSQDGKYYWVVFPCTLNVKTKPAEREGLQIALVPQNPVKGQSSKLAWSYTNTWGEGHNFTFEFYLRKPNYETVLLQRTTEYVPKNGHAEGTVTIPAQTLPGKYVVMARYSIDGSTPTTPVTREFFLPGVGEPSVQDFVNTLINYYGSSIPTIDVSQRLMNSAEYLDKATVFGIRGTYFDDNYGSGGTLVLYLNHPESIEVEEYGYDRPPERGDTIISFARDVFAKWLEGVELERMYSSKSGKWYWVKIPCSLTYTIHHATPILTASGNTITFGVKGDWCSEVSGGHLECGRRPYGVALLIEFQFSKSLIGTIFMTL